MSDKTLQSRSVLGEMQPSKAIVKLAVPATLALLAKAAYNIVDTAYIGMLNSDIALTAVGVTVPLLLIMVSIENIFTAGAAVLACRQLGQQDHAGAERTELHTESGDMYAREIESFSSSILTGSPLEVPASDAVQVQRVIELAYRSNDEKKLFDL